MSSQTITITIPELFESAVQDVLKFELFNHPACANVLSCMLENSKLVTYEITSEAQPLTLTYRPVTHEAGELTATYGNLFEMESIDLISNIKVYEFGEMTFQFVPRDIFLMAQVLGGVILPDGYQPEATPLLEAIKAIIDRVDLDL